MLARQETFPLFKTDYHLKGIEEERSLIQRDALYGVLKKKKKKPTRTENTAMDVRPEVEEGPQRAGKISGTRLG